MIILTRMSLCRILFFYTRAQGLQWITALPGGKRSWRQCPLTEDGMLSALLPSISSFLVPCTAYYVKRWTGTKDFRKAYIPKAFTVYAALLCVYIFKVFFTCLFVFLFVLCSYPKHIDHFLELRCDRCNSCFFFFFFYWTEDCSIVKHAHSEEEWRPFLIAPGKGA